MNNIEQFDSSPDVSENNTEQEKLRFQKYDDQIVQQYRSKKKKINDLMGLVPAYEAIRSYEMMVVDKLREEYGLIKGDKQLIKLDLHHILSGSTPGDEGCEFSDIEQEDYSLRRFLEIISDLNPKKFKKSEASDDNYDFEDMTDVEAKIFEENKNLIINELKKLKEKNNDLENLSSKEIKEKSIDKKNERRKFIMEFLTVLENK